MPKCKNCLGYKNIVSCTVNASGRHHSVDDVPAILWDDDEGWWFQNGLKHRVGRAAIETTVKTTCQGYYNKWYLHGNLHKIDGPAVTWHDNTHSWYYKGVEVSMVTSSQEIIVGRSVTIEEDVATVIRHVEGCFYEVLWGNKKVLIAKG